MTLDLLHKKSLESHSAIEDIYLEIEGYDEKDEDSGKEVRINGLKDNLKTTYDDLQKNLDETIENVNDLSNKYISINEKQNEERGKEFDELVQGWKKNYDDIKSEIEGLLPAAITKGLSKAYSDKKKEEIDENENLSNVFTKSIWGMVLISLIPFGIGITFLVKGAELKTVIYDLPRIVLSILPLYIPAFWVAYASNKRVNLSKRLIEEYSHKEVVGKTFEGLSKQIETIDDDEVNQELRAKLLFNLLQVSSENPGKLITDYNKADHPLMDVLDKSAKLSGSMEKLSNVPGVNKILKMLSEKANRDLNEKGKKVAEGLNTIAYEEDDDDEGENVESKDV